MSGILGIWNLDGRPVERAELARLSATLAHRGTDAEGLELRGSAGFACRLSRIAPESVFETQPLVDASGVSLVFDGRLDNRAELLAALQPTADVSTDCPDPDLVLAAYHAYGDRFPEQLNGDFALGLFDPSRRQILLARDAIGLRPLYYYANGRLVVFASEIKALLAHPEVPSRPADDVLADFLFNRLRAEDERGLTLFQDIFSVLPAHVAIVTREQLVTRRYWDFNLAPRIRLRSFEDYVGAFRHYFEQAVHRRLRSAHPVAVAVSGGLDSSAIFCTAERLSRAPGRAPAPLFGASNVGPDGSAFDETRFLVDIEREYAVKLHRFENRPGLLEDCRDAVWHVEAPLLDAQWNTLHHFMSSVRQLGARVLLTGHFGDQFIFDDAYLVDLCRRGAWSKAWRHAGEYPRWLNLSDTAFFKRRLLKRIAQSCLPDRLIPVLRGVRRTLRPAGEPWSWYTEQLQRRASTSGSGRTARPLSSHHARSLYGEARGRYHVLCVEWTNKVAAMHGLDIALPFLDRDLIAFLIATPGEIQSARGVPKGLFREALRGVLPETIARRTGKGNFTGAVNEGMSQDFDRILELLRATESAGRMGYVRPTMLQQIGRMKSALLGPTCTASWAIRDLLGLELWLQTFFDGTVKTAANPSELGLVEVQ